jgi:hypothetical protein
MLKMGLTRWLAGAGLTRDWARRVAAARYARGMNSSDLPEPGSNDRSPTAAIRGDGGAALNPERVGTGEQSITRRGEASDANGIGPDPRGDANRDGDGSEDFGFVHNAGGGAMPPASGYVPKRRPRHMSADVGASAALGLGRLLRTKHHHAASTAWRAI